MTVATLEVLAHQGGWDEILLVAGPLVAFAAVLFLANRRANTKLAARAAATHESTADDSVGEDLED